MLGHANQGSRFAFGIAKPFAELMLLLIDNRNRRPNRGFDEWLQVGNAAGFDSHAGVHLASVSPRHHAGRERLCGGGETISALQEDLGQLRRRLKVADQFINFRVWLIEAPIAAAYTPQDSLSLE
jgi:hypothetical protein